MDKPTFMTMKEEPDRKPDIIKLETELILMDDDECYTGASHEATCRTPNASSFYYNPSVPETTDLVDSVTTATRSTLSEGHDVKGLLTKIKVECTENEDPLAGCSPPEISQNSPETVPSTSYGDYTGFHFVGKVGNSPTEDVPSSKRWQDSAAIVPSSSFGVNTGFHAEGFKLKREGNPIDEERINLNLVNDSSSATRIKSENDFVLDLVPRIKVENTQDEVSSTDPLLDCGWDVSPKPIPSERSASFWLEGVSVKPENSTSEGKLPPNEICKFDTMENSSCGRILVNSAPKKHSSSFGDESTMSGDVLRSDKQEFVNDSDGCICIDDRNEGSLQTFGSTIVSPLQSFALPEIEPSLPTQACHSGVLIEAEQFANCPAKFRMHENLKRHVETCSGEQINLEKRARKHSVTLSSDRPYACTLCPSRYKCKNILNKHLLVHSDEMPFPCEQCSAQFKSKGELKSHLVYKHSDERPFSCDQCSACFKVKGQLNRHLKQMHSNERPFSCDQCSGRFKTKGKLNSHTIHKHSDEKLFSCDQCSRCFKTKEELNCHLINKHSDKKRFSCEACSAEFKFKGNFRRHLNSHSNVRPFPCDMCSGRFKLKGDLNRHLITVHSNERPFACDQCSERFKLKRDLNSHLIGKHSDKPPFACDECSRHFASKPNLKSHLRYKHSDERPFFCDKCSARFKSKITLDRHRLEVHSDERPFFCDECSTRFKSRRTLKRHLLRAHSS